MTPLFTSLMLFLSAKAELLVSIRFIMSLRGMENFYFLPSILGLVGDFFLQQTLLLEFKLIFDCLLDCLVKFLFPVEESKFTNR